MRAKRSVSGTLSPPTRAMHMHVPSVAVTVRLMSSVVGAVVSGPMRLRQSPARARLVHRCADACGDQMAVVIHDSRDERAHGFAYELDAVGTRPDEALSGFDETPQVQLETELSPRALWS